MDLRKLIRESLEEMFIGEDYPQSFDMEVFKSLKTFQERINYCKNRLARIAAGSSRIVFKIDEEKVLKLAKNTKGIAQNETEIDRGSDSYFSYILARVFDSHPEGLWVEMELAKKITASEFKRITGFDVNTVGHYLRNFEMENRGKRPIFYIDKKIESQLDADEFVQSLREFVAGTDAMAADLGVISSYGLVHREGSDSIVLIDFGITRDIYATHYDKSKNMASMYEGEENKSNINDNFKNWFAGSKVVDKNGNPMVVHHGTSKKFSKFNFKNALQQIIWFTSNKSAIEAGEVGAAGKGHIMDLYVSMKNPAGWNEYEKYGLGQLESMGYDGAILPDPDGTFTGFVFEPTQLKSVKNKGEWSSNDKSIYKEENIASNYSIENWPDGKYKGFIKGSEVYSDEIDSGFIATSAWKSRTPIPCTIYVKDGKAVVCAKPGIIFSSDEAEADYRKEYGKGMESMKKYPGMKEYMETIKENDLSFEEKGDQINFTDSLGGSGFLVKKNGGINIVDWHSVPMSKRYGDEESQYKRRGFAKKVIQAIKDMGYNKFTINMPSNEANAALARLSQTGAITPVKGSERGLSDMPYYTQYEIN